MRRWTLPAVSAALAAAALFRLQTTQPPARPWAPEAGKPRTVVRTSLEGVDHAGGATVVRAQGLRLRLSGGGARLESIGPQSDALLSAFDHVCGGDRRPGAMRESSRFTLSEAEGSLDALGRAPVTLKLSFESEPEERYAELFVAVDPALRAVSLQERDDRHCPAVVRFLAKP